MTNNTNTAPIVLFGTPTKVLGEYLIPVRSKSLGDYIGQIDFSYVDDMTKYGLDDVDYSILGDNGFIITNGPLDDDERALSISRSDITMAIGTLAMMRMELPDGMYDDVKDIKAEYGWKSRTDWDDDTWVSFGASLNDVCADWGMPDII